MRHFFLLIFTGFFLFQVNAQEEVVRFCRFDNLQKSPSGKEVIFDCYYYEENTLESPVHQILLTEIEFQKSRCLNPLVSRFVISKDKKSLVFASLFGIFQFGLAKPDVCIQLKFLNPAEDKLVSELGFFKDSQNIYWSLTSSTGETVEEKFVGLQMPVLLTERFIQSAQVLELPKRRVEKFDLPVAGPETGRLREVQLANQKKLEFHPVSTTRSDLFDLFWVDQKTGKSKKLLEKIRPRLMSPNPERTGGVLAVWTEKSGGETWYLGKSTAGLKLLAKWEAKFVSWLSTDEAILLGNGNLFRYHVIKSQVESIKFANLPGWYMAKSGQRSSAQAAVKLRARINSLETDFLIKIQNRGKRFVRSQILLEDEKTGKSVVLVPEMNNIPEGWQVEKE